MRLAVQTGRRGRPVLGVEINAVEIRVVEMEGVWPEPHILRADSIPTPPDSMNGDEICRPDLVGKALVTLLTRMGVRTRRAVLALPSSAVVTRVLDIPMIPEPELRTIVQGEVLHQNIVVDGQGEFDYMRLDTGAVRPQTRPRLLLMASPGRLVDGYHQAAGLAGLQLIGLEPGLIALYRAASSPAYSRPPCLCLMIGTMVSEVAIMDHGPIRVYRRLDMGSRQILSELEAPWQPQSVAEMPGGEAPDLRFNLDGTQAEVEAAPRISGRITADITDNTAVNSLTVELQRSLDYYQREHPDAPPVDSIVIVASQPELTPLAAWLSEKLQISAVMAALPTTASSDPELHARLAEPAALRFLRASGLAMQGLEKLPEGLPQFNLLGRRKAERTPSAVSGRMAFALTCSILVLLLGSFNLYRTVQQANSLDHELTGATQNLRQLRFYRGVSLEEVRRQKEMLNVLLPVGESLPTVVDAMARAVPPDASLMEVARDKPGELALTGETSNDTVLVQFLDALRQLPACTKVSLDSLNRNSPVENRSDGKPDVLHYSITAQIRPMP